MEHIRSSEEAVRHFSDTAGHYAAKHYDEAVRTFMTVRERRVLELVDGLELPERSDVLDAGCGPGYLVLQMASRGFRVSGLDGATGMLTAARARVDSADLALTVDLRQGDIEALPYDGESFDLVLSTGVIEYLEEDATVLGEFFRVLRPGGHLVLPVTNRRSPVLWLDGGVEFLKRRKWFRAPLNAALARMRRRPVHPRHFLVRQHNPVRFRASLEAAGFEMVDHLYFHFLPWPRPIDQLLPRVTDALGSRMEGLARSPLGGLGEGYLTLSKKPLPGQ